MIKISNVLFLSLILCARAHGMLDQPKKIESKSITPPNLFTKTLSYCKSSSPIHKSNSKENLLLTLVKKNDPGEVYKFFNPDINEPDEEGNTPFIIAARNGNEFIIDMLLKKKKLEPNAQNKWGMTALHYAALNNHLTIIEKLICDPRIDASIKNGDNGNARELLDQSEKTVRAYLYSRVNLDQVVYEEKTCAMLMNMDLSTQMNDLINTIRNRIIADEIIQQNDGRQLPEAALFPPYADDEFLKKMITYRIVQKKKPFKLTLDLTIIK